MKSRCKDSSIWQARSYKDKGIKCLWNSFDEFKKDMYKSYQYHVKKHGENDTQIDRINNDGHYCKENCRWVTHKKNQNNKSDSVWVTFKGKTMTVAQWAEKLNVKRGFIVYRVKHKNSDLGYVKHTDLYNKGHKRQSKRHV